MLKILQARLQQYVYHELPDVQAGFRKVRGTRDQIANIYWIIEKARVSEKHLVLLYRLHKSLDCVDHNKLWKILRDGNTRPLDLPPEISVYRSRQIVRTGHGTMDWLPIGKGVCQGYILWPCLFNLYTEYLMWNSGLAESQAGVKIARRNINNLRWRDDTTLMAESGEEPKSLLMTVKE